MSIQILHDQPNFQPTYYADRDGLLAIGGWVHPNWLKQAYPRGIFPWYEEGSPVLWFTPSPRCVLNPQEVYVSKSMRQVIRQSTFEITYDQAFEQVIQHCGSVARPGQEGTWITKELSTSLMALHEEGVAHSCEVWHEEKLVGGLYGLSFGQIFFGESMFSLMPNCSKLALIHFCRHFSKWGGQLIDCQMETPHLISMGAKTINRNIFEEHLAILTVKNLNDEAWKNFN